MGNSHSRPIAGARHLKAFVQTANELAQRLLDFQPRPLDLRETLVVLGLARR